MADYVSLRVYDLRGRMVRELFSGERPAGPGMVVWDGRDDHARRLSSGFYFVRIETAGQSTARRIVLLGSGG